MYYEWIGNFFVMLMIVWFFLRMYIKHIEKDIPSEDKSSAPNQEVDDDGLF